MGPIPALPSSFPSPRKATKGKEPRRCELTFKELPLTITINKFCRRVSNSSFSTGEVEAAAACESVPVGGRTDVEWDVEKKPDLSQSQPLHFPVERRERADIRQEFGNGTTG